MPRKGHSASWRREQGVVRVTMRLDGNSGWQIKPELTPQELQAIGLITVQWAHLEHCLLVRTLLLAESAKVDRPQDARNLSFSKRLRAFRDLAKTAIGDKDEMAAIKKLADRIANAESQRHKITHGMWDWDETNPEKLAAYSLREPFDYEHPFDLDKLSKLADRLGELLFELSFPHGLSDVQPLPFPARFSETPFAVPTKQGIQRTRPRKKLRGPLNSNVTPR